MEDTIWYHAMTIIKHVIQLLQYVTITTKKFSRPQLPDADRLTFATAPFLMETSWIRSERAGGKCWTWEELKRKGRSWDLENLRADVLATGHCQIFTKFSLNCRGAASLACDHQQWNWFRVAKVCSRCFAADCFETCSPIFGWQLQTYSHFLQLNSTVDDSWR